MDGIQVIYSSKMRLHLLAATAILVPAGLAAQSSGNSEPVNLLPGEAPAASIEQQTVEMDGAPVVSEEVVQAIDEMGKPKQPIVQAWTVERARALAAIVEGVSKEGLVPADYNLDGLRAAIAMGGGAALDEAASQSFQFLVEDLRDGRTPMDSRKQWFVFDPDQDRYPTGELMADALASGDIAGTLARIMPEHPDYSRLKRELAATPAEQAKRHKLIRANMDRWRWLPRDLGGQYLLVNVPEYRLDLMVNGQSVRQYRTIVGKPGSTATPQMAESVEGVVFNPTWTVPQSIVKGEGLGRRVLGNPRWARANGYSATRGANGYVSVVQAPGPGNSLGAMKLDMPNAEAIFLHDTPAKALFDRKARALSHGCIRTEDALELALTVNLLGQGASVTEALRIAESGDYTQVPVARPIPVYIAYFTVVPDGAGGIAELGDIYRRDAPVLAALDNPRQRVVQTAGL